MSPSGEDKRDDRDPDEGFLTRWSRRKREIAVQAPEPPVAPPRPTPEAAPDERPRDPETGEPIDEAVVARLPAISEIKAGDDLSMFMQRGVPEALRREALRAMWVNDPAIRDFVGPALDYAYDYNTPGAAPGYGPLSESDIAQGRAMIEKLLSRAEPSDAAKSDPSDDEDCDKSSHLVAKSEPEAVRRSLPASQHTQAVDVAALSELGAKPAPESVTHSESAPRHDVQRNHAEAAGTPEPASARPRKRRGGGATPL